MPRIKHLTAWILCFSLFLGPAAAHAAEKKAAPARDSQWVNQIFQQGKAHYESGDYASAMREWNKLDPYLDQYPSFKKVIGYLKNQILTGPGTAMKASPAALGEPIRVKETFKDADERLKSTLQEEVQEKARLKVSSTEQEAWIRSTLRKGQVAYENGDWDTAFEEWNKIQPFLDPTSPEAVQLVKLRKDLEMVRLAKKQNEDLLRKKKAELNMPQDFTAMMQVAQKKLEQQIIEIQSRQETIEKDAVFEQAWVNTTFERGKAAYEAGNHDLAVEEWDKLIFKLKGQPEMAAAIEQFKKTVRAHKEAEMGFSQVTGQTAASVHPQSAEMARFLKQAASDLKSKADNLSRESGEKQQSVADQQKRVNETFERGKQLYLQGKHQEALNEWLLLSSYFEGDLTLRAAFLSAQGSLQAHQLATTTYQTAVDGGSYKVQLPDGFFRFVENANHELAERTRATEAEKQKTELAVASKRAELMRAFEQGKRMYAEGRIGEAIGEWKKIAPWVENSEEFQAELQKMEANYQEASLQTRALKDARSKAGGVYSAPAELAQLISTANEDLKNQAQSATNERIVLQQNFNDRQAKVSNILYKADLALKAGKTDQAVAEWEKLAPYIDPASEEAALIDSVKQSYAEYAQAVKLRREASSQKQGVVQLPKELKAALSKTNDELIKDASQARVDSETQSLELKEKQAAIVSAVEKGKLFYQTGRIEQAVAEWEKLFPYLDRASEERLLIENLKQNYLDEREAQRQKQAVASAKDSVVSVPEELKTMLVALNQDLAAKTAQARSEKESVEQSYNDRQTQTLATFEKAKVYTQAGRVGEAIEEWKKIVDQLDEASNARVLVRELESNHRQYALSKQALEESLPKKDAKFAAPDGLALLIEDAKRKLASDIEDLRSAKTKLDEDLAERQALVNRSFEAGKALAAEGKWLEAVYEWEKLTPYLEASSGLTALLKEIKLAWNTLQDTKKSNEIFIATQYKDVKLPFTAEIEKSLIALDGSIRKDMDALRATRSQLEKTQAERQAWVQSTFEKGKAYYEVGKYKEAIDFWVSLAPHLKTEAKAQALLATLPQRYQELEAAQSAARTAETLKTSPLEPPAELEKLAAELTEKMGLAHNEAMTVAERSKQEADGRQANMNALFAAGEKAYQEGRWEEAIRSWAGLPEYVRDPAKVKAMVDNLAASYQNYLRIRQEAKNAESRLAGKFDPPADLSALLADATIKLDKQRQESQLSKERTDAIFAEKDAAVKKIYAEGKAFYDLGKLTDAFAAWRSMLPSLKDAEELTEALDKADESYQLYLLAKTQNQDSLARKEMKLVAPDELAMILETANTKLRDDIFDYKSRTMQTQKMMEDRKSWVAVTFEKGKLAHSQGRYQDAAAEWKTLLPFIENGAQFEKLISDFERNMGVSLEASKINQEVEAAKNAKFPAPDELGVLLLELNEKVKNEALEANAAKIRSEQQSSERRAWVQATFESGKELYQQGKFDEAIAEWEKLSPYLEAQEGTQKLIAAVKENYTASQNAKKSAVEAAAQDYQGLQLPYVEEMTRLLGQADDKLKTEAQEFAEKKVDLEKTMAERREWSVNTFNKGKVLYDQGRYEEALGQWERLLPYLADGSQIKTQIQGIRESYNTILAGKHALGDTGGAEPAVRLANEDELLGVLEEAAQKFKSDAEALKQEKLEIEKSFAQRKEWIEYTFNKGKSYYDQGNYAKAVEEWGVLGPYLGEHPSVRDSIEEAKKSYAEGRYTRQLIETMEAKKAALLDLPQKTKLVETAPIEVEPSEEEQKPVIEEEATLEEVAQEEAETPAGEVQLVTGEVESIDEEGRTLTLRVISETGESQSLTVTFNEATKMGGSSAKTVSAIPSGTEIDVRYNPQTSQAIYVYVY